MAAALDEEAVGHRLAYHPSEINAGDRAAGAGADPARLERDRKGRATEFLPEAGGDEPDHARMPAFGRSDHHRALLLDPERRHGFCLGLRHGCDLDRLALAIEPVELG